MSKKAKKGSPGFANDANTPGAKKPQRTGPAGSPTRKGGNPGETNPAGNEMVQGASHQGSSLGKRNSG